MRTQISVTRNLIAEGTRCSESACPIALALKGTLPLRTKVSVNCDFVEINGRAIRLPKRASDFIEKFDQKWDADLKPFSFNLVMW